MRTAEFFSFGTNDLTQTCLGMNCDDSGSAACVAHSLSAFVWLVSFAVKINTAPVPGAAFFLGLFVPGIAIKLIKP